MAEYTTREGDVLDAICWEHYGRTDGVVEAVLEANPGLASLQVSLPVGTVITLPDLPKPPVDGVVVKLWD